MVQVKQKISDKGTVLGLSISKELIELMGGEISVKRKLGVGTSFSINIPLKEGKFQKTKLKEKNNKFNYSVLLVDDREINIKVGSLLLLSLGCEIDVAKDGQEAVTMIKNNSYDLILMDIQMPIMDGITAMKTIKEQSLTNSPVYALH